MFPIVTMGLFPRTFQFLGWIFIVFYMGLVFLVRFFFFFFFLVLLWVCFFFVVCFLFLFFFCFFFLLLKVVVPWSCGPSQLPLVDALCL